jgi:maltokinase
VTAPSLEAFPGMLGSFLARQRWFPQHHGSVLTGAQVRVVDSEEIREGRPGLVWLTVEAAGELFQVPVGIREEYEATQMLRGRESAIIGRLEDGSGVLLAYDGLADPQLCLYLLEVMSGGTESASRVRTIGSGSTNTCLLYDESVVLKVFRRTDGGRNLHAEMVNGLHAVGFERLAPLLFTLQIDGRDVAIAQEYLSGGTTGWSLALSSLRDLYALGTAPESAGGDFGNEARRLGEMTAEMHLALLEAFGSERGRPAEWAARIAEMLAGLGERLPPDKEHMLERLSAVEEPGRWTRGHGDYHLGHVMRTELGWRVVDLKGYARRPAAERRRFASPLSDVADMLRSLHYATAVASRERGPVELDVGGQADAWEQRNRHSFLRGYLATPGIDRLMPPDPVALDLMLKSAELEGAAAETARQLGERPWWKNVSRRALDRLLVSAV